MTASVRHIQPTPPDQPRIAIVVSRYNRWITDALEQGAIDEFNRLAGGRGEATILPAPGAFELPGLAAAAARTGRFDAVVCLGCVIRGETDHYDFICQAVAHGIMQVMLKHSQPVSFGLLTTHNEQQARDRSGGVHGNKGVEAAVAVLKMLNF